MAEPDFKQVENFKELCRISDLKPDQDTIYLSKTIEGMRHTHFCLFKGFFKGMVEGQIIWINPSHAFYEPRDKGRIIRARLDSCYLWGANPNAGRDQEEHICCQWFSTASQPAGGF